METALPLPPPHCVTSLMNANLFFFSFGQRLPLQITKTTFTLTFN
jgi:hypothetical protein